MFFELNHFQSIVNSAQFFLMTYDDDDDEQGHDVAALILFLFVCLFYSPPIDLFCILACYNVMVVRPWMLM